jgi:hypothetical protein
MDIEGTIQFIVNQQAQFVADIHTLQLRMDQLTTDVEKLHNVVKRHEELLQHHEDAHVVTYGMISKLTGVVTDHVERQSWLFDAHRRTEEKLDRLIDKLDGFIDEVRRGLTGRNGGAESA